MSRRYIVIPARYESTRLPAKPLADIAGKPMIQRVYEQACKTQTHQSGSKIYIATDHQKIVDAVDTFGGTALLTSTDHLTGTDRLAEVATLLNLDDDDIIINVQGDEPLIPPEVIDQVTDNLIESNFDMATLATEIMSENDFQDASTVKVIMDKNGKALYFSRAPIPATRATKHLASYPTAFIPLRHIGIYAYKVKLLKAFPSWQRPPMEIAESLEQLRILHQGCAIHVALACRPVPHGIDTPKNLIEINALLLEKITV